MTLEINRIFPRENLILLSLDCIVNGSDISDKSEHNWNTVFLGKINEMKLFRIIALLEGLSYILLLFVAVPVKYSLGDPTYVKLLGMPHGILFVAYLGFAFYFKQEQNWSMKTLAIVLLGSVVPFGTFYVDNKYLRTK